MINFFFSNNENEKYFTVSGGHEEIVEDNCSSQVIHESSIMAHFYDSLFMSHLNEIVIFTLSDNSGFGFLVTATLKPLEISVFVYFDYEKGLISNYYFHKLSK